MEIRDLLVEVMQDQYDAEKQLVKALPKMVKASSNPELRQAFANHLEETKGHVERLDQAFGMIGVKAKGKPCAAMKGLIEEAQEVVAKKMEDELQDSGIICAAQKVEHYEIAGYGTICAWASAMGLDDVAELLQETLDEEKAADEKLSQVADAILVDAVASGEEAERAPSKTRTAGSHRSET
jgi:ferritin-like metal-binding protein YciE